MYAFWVLKEPEENTGLNNPKIITGKEKRSDCGYRNLGAGGGALWGSDSELHCENTV